MNYPYYNPYQFGPQMAVQSRPVEMVQNYVPQQNAAPVQTVGQTQGISAASRPVSSKEEAMAVGADFSGAPMIFPDMAHNAVYMKRWDYSTGSAVFVEYTPKGADPETPPAAYATQGEFKQLADSVEEIMDRFDSIEMEFEKLKARRGVKKNDDE